MQKHQRPLTKVIHKASGNVMFVEKVGPAYELYTEEAEKKEESQEAPVEEETTPRKPRKPRKKDK